MKKWSIVMSFILISATLSGQTSKGVVYGRVTDISTGDVIPSATIVVVNTSMGTATDIEGKYQIENLAPGMYQVRVSAIGYSAIIKSDVMVSNSKPTQADFQLQPEVFQLSGITVTADYFNKTPLEFNSTRSFGYEEIRRAPGGFEDVLRALSVLPGIAQAGAGRNDLVVRGGAPSENLFLLDGVEIPNINHFGTQGSSGGPQSYINLDYIKETNFSSGGFPVLYGDRLSSVLQIDLRSGRADRFGGKATVSASQFGLNVEGPVTQKSSFLFSARRSYLDFIFKAAGFGFIPEYYDFLGKYDFGIDEKNEISVFGISALDNVRYNNSTADQRFSNSRVLGTDQQQYTTAFVFRHLFDKGFYRVYAGRNYVHYNSMQKDSSLNTIFKNISTEVENKVKFENLYQITPSIESNSGIEINYIQFQTDIQLASLYTSFGENLPYGAVNYKKNYLKYGAYTNLTLNLSERLKTNAGIRLDYFDGIQLRYSFSPRLSLSYTLTPDMNISLSTGIYHQSPAYIWLSTGNKDLKTIQDKQFILGTDYRLREDTQIKVEYYYKDYSNYVVSMIRPYLSLSNTGVGYGGSGENFSSFGLEPLASAGTGIAKGLEFSLQKKMSEIPYYGLVSLTYGSAQFRALDGIWRNGSYDQRWIFNISGGYQYSESVIASVRFRFASGRPYTPYHPGGMQYAAEYNAQRLKSIHSLDVRIDKYWFWDQYTLIAYLDLQNIYNQKNIDSVRWNARDMAEEESKSFGILPSIGVSLEF